MYARSHFCEAERASGVTESAARAKLEFAKISKKETKSAKGWGKLGLSRLGVPFLLIWEAFADLKRADVSG